jgi:hypothetical protein
MKRSYILISVLVVLSGNTIVAAPEAKPGLFDGLFDLINSNLRVVTVAKSTTGNTHTFSVNPKNTAICAGTIFVLWKMSGHLADALYPYVLNALPAVGPIAHAQEKHALQKQEEKIAHEERVREAREKIEKIKAEQQTMEVARQDLARL